MKAGQATAIPFNDLEIAGFETTSRHVRPTPLFLLVIQSELQEENLQTHSVPFHSDVEPPIPPPSSPRPSFHIQEAIKRSIAVESVTSGFAKAC